MGLSYLAWLRHLLLQSIFQSYILYYWLSEDAQI